MFLINDVDVFSGVMDELINILLKIIPLCTIPVLLSLALKLFDPSYLHFGLDKNSKVDDVPVKESSVGIEEEPTEKTVVETCVINSLGKMQPVTRSRDIPLRCPNCWGIPDDSESCQYCGSRLV